jgi:predicted small secreted protein
LRQLCCFCFRPCLLVGCNTPRGIGKDVKSVGGALDRAAD